MKFTKFFTLVFSLLTLCSASEAFIRADHFNPPEIEVLEVSIEENGIRAAEKTVVVRFKTSLTSGENILTVSLDRAGPHKLLIKGQSEDVTRELERVRDLANHLHVKGQVQSIEIIKEKILDIHGDLSSLLQERFGTRGSLTYGTFAASAMVVAWLAMVPVLGSGLVGAGVAVGFDLINSDWRPFIKEFGIFPIGLAGVGLMAFAYSFKNALNILSDVTIRTISNFGYRYSLFKDLPTQFKFEGRFRSRPRMCLSFL